MRVPGSVLRWIADRPNLVFGAERALTRLHPEAARRIAAAYKRQQDPARLAAGVDTFAELRRKDSERTLRRLAGLDRPEGEPGRRYDDFYAELAANPLHWRLLNMFHLDLDLGGSELDRALPVVRWIANRYPNNVRARLALGYVHTNRGERAEAIDAFRLAADLTARQLIEAGDLSSDQAGGTQPVPLTFAVLGAVKGGTTSLDRWLTEHPAILPTIEKEPRLFHWYDEGEQWRLAHQLRVRNPERYVCGLNDAGALTADRRFAGLLALDLPDLRLVVLHRDPVDRAWSHFQMHARNGRNRGTFEEMVMHTLDRFPVPPTRQAEIEVPELDFLLMGCLLPFVRHWLDAFPAEQLCVVESAALFNDPQATMSALYAFLGLEDHVSASHRARNVGGYDASIPDRTAEILRSWYEPHERAFYEFLDQRNVTLIGRDGR